MGHHIFANELSVLVIEESDQELVRHCLILGAMDVGLDEAAKAIERWERIGPGVWINVETQAFVDYPAIFEAAVQAIDRLGTTIDVAYLKTKLRRFGTIWLRPQEARLVVQNINRLRQHVSVGGAESPES
jgi:hypothetical protein